MFKSYRRKRILNAVRKNNLKQVERLIRNVEDAALPDKKGRSLLAIAYNYDSTNLIEFLRSKGLREEMNELYNYAVRCFYRSEFAEAQKRFQELVRLMPKNPKTHYYLGNAHFKIFETERIKTKGNTDLTLLEKSVGSINKSLEVNQEDKRLEKVKLSQAYYILGYYCNQTNKPDEAKRLLQDSINLDIKNEDAQNLLTQIK